MPLEFPVALKVLIYTRSAIVPRLTLHEVPGTLDVVCISELIQPFFAVPLDFSQLLRHYTTDGFRVLGLAYKTLTTVKTFEEAQQLTRCVSLHEVFLPSHFPLLLLFLV